MAAGDLTTVERVKEILRIQDPSDDAFIAAMVTASSAWIKAEIGRDYAVADHVYTFDGDGGRGVTLPDYPVVSVSSVTVDDEAIPERVETTGTGWVLSNGRVELVGFRFYAGTDNCQIAYRAGEEAPADVAQATAEHAAIRYRDRDWGSASSRSLAGDTTDRRGEVASGQWAFIRSVIAHHRRYWV